MKTLKEKIAVMQAAADGKEIEYKPLGDDKWLPVPHPTWNWTGFDYRIKPQKPKEVWVALCLDGKPCAVVPSPAGHPTARLFREVIEENKR